MTLVLLRRCSSMEDEAICRCAFFFGGQMPPSVFRESRDSFYSGNAGADGSSLFFSQSLDEDGPLLLCAFFPASKTINPATVVHLASRVLPSEGQKSPAPPPPERARSLCTLCLFWPLLPSAPFFF